jgi:hypothetical protein
MPLVAADANQQIATLQRFIAQRTKDGKVTQAEANAILTQAKKENVQGGELALLRNLATSGQVVPKEKDAFIKAVDQIVPQGAPTAKLAAIIFRVNPNTGRNQLLKVLDDAKNPVPGGPKTFVVTGLGRPYLAAITTAQITLGLTKFLDGAGPKQATQIRHYLGEQLKTFETPVAKGGLAVNGRVPAPKGLAFSDDTREGGIIAINQQATVLRALDKVSQLPGAANAKLAAHARSVATKVSHELSKDLDFAYPATGRLAYSLTMRGKTPETVQLEDGQHLLTTMQALRALSPSLRAPFDPVIARVEKRLPEIAFCGPEDLTGTSGQIFTPEFDAFRAAAHTVLGKAKVTQSDYAALKAKAMRDGLLTPGESGLLAEVKKRVQ